MWCDSGTRANRSASETPAWRQWWSDGGGAKLDNKVMTSDRYGGGAMLDNKVVTSDGDGGGAMSNNKVVTSGRDGGGAMLNNKVVTSDGDDGAAMLNNKVGTSDGYDGAAMQKVGTSDGNDDAMQMAEEEDDYMAAEVGAAIETLPRTRGTKRPGGAHNQAERCVRKWAEDHGGLEHFVDASADALGGGKMYADKVAAKKILDMFYQKRFRTLAEYSASDEGFTYLQWLVARRRQGGGKGGSKGGNGGCKGGSKGGYK